jgi:hypothetical protein
MITISVFFLILIQSAYDFLGWNVILKENPDKKWKNYFFRISKFILDFPVTIIILHFLNVSYDVIFWFFILKSFGWCDAFYIMYWQILNPQRKYVDDIEKQSIWWLWWTFPFGIFESIFQSIRNKKIVKGNVSFLQFEIGLGIGLLSFIIYLLSNVKIF